MTNRKKLLINAISCFLIISSVRASERVSVVFGLNTIPNNNISDARYNELITKNGYFVGLIVPINLPLVDVHVKVEYIRHDVESVTSFGREVPFDFTYSPFNNEIMIGKIIRIAKISILPQVCLGRADEVCYSDENAFAIRDHYYYSGFSIRIQPRFKIVQPGLYFQIQKGIANVHASDFRSSVKIKTGFILSI